MTPDSAPAAHSRIFVFVVIASIALTALILWSMGRAPICTCGYVKPWVGVVLSSDNSQHLTDWYTFSHIIHGFLFYGALWLVGGRLSIGPRLLVATALEWGWEIFENTDFIINRYREATISLDYHGDSILNSVSDILAMIAGFMIASRAPVLLVIGAGLALELFAGAMIRDNLTLNIVMLLWPMEWIKQWQAGA